MKLPALLLGQKRQQLSPEQRQQMRQDMRDVYKDANRQDASRREKPRQMAPQQREQLRRDVDEASRRMKR